jgi:hypothetical protein
MLIMIEVLLKCRTLEYRSEPVCPVLYTDQRNGLPRVSRALCAMLWFQTSGGMRAVACSGIGMWHILQGSGTRSVEHMIADCQGHRDLYCCLIITIILPVYISDRPVVEALGACI